MVNHRRTLVMPLVGFVSPVNALKYAVTKKCRNDRSNIVQPVRNDILLRKTQLVSLCYVTFFSIINAIAKRS